MVYSLMGCYSAYQGYLPGCRPSIGCYQRVHPWDPEGWDPGSEVQIQGVPLQKSHSGGSDGRKDEQRGEAIDTLDDIPPHIPLLRRWPVGAYVVALLPSPDGVARWGHPRAQIGVGSMSGWPESLDPGQIGTLHT